jgi:hypothetical protein
MLGRVLQDVQSKLTYTFRNVVRQNTVPVAPKEETFPDKLKS